MSVQVEKLENGMAKLTIETSAERLEEALQNAFTKNKNKISVPGFRKGKVPRQMIEKMYGPAIFYEDAANELIPEEYEKALDECEEDIVSSPEIDVTQIEKGKPFIFTAVVALKPEVKLGKYKGVKVDKADTAVTDEEVDAQINKERENNARNIEVTDRPVKDGDMTVLDFEGFVDGVAFDGGKDSGHHLKLGSGQFIPGFEEGIVGKNVGEEFDVNVTFPEQYGAAELAGKAAVFKVKLNALEKTELPEADDDFAVDVSEFNTFAEYRADLASKIEKRHKDNADNELSEKVEDALAEKLVAEIPESMVDSEVEAQVRESESRMQMQGLQLSMYLKYFNMTLDQYKEQIRPSALKHVKTELALEKIAELESVEVSEDEINAEYETIAKAYSVEVDYAKENLPAEEIKHTLVMRKTLALVKDAAKVTYLDKAPEAPAPAGAG